MFGAETTDCDSPTSLINATFKWINDNLKDELDFVIWTGDSARHDSDEEIPRTREQVLELNELLVDKFVEVFGKEDNINDTDPANDFTIPIIPSFGNNDIMPHNIFRPGPNDWTGRYAKVWEKFIPEEQRHGFQRGGWFSVEVIPKQLTVFSLNTLYFFDSNTAVDGCYQKSEPGYEQMEWLRIQLHFLRERGMKAILTGHVPPARTENKFSWDETCWQKYTLWLRQYRDVVVGSVYGHMNIDHFMLQDFEDISDKALKGKESVSRMALDDELTIQSSADYLTDLREGWSQLPDPPKGKKKSRSGLGYFYHLFEDISKKKPQKSREERFLEKIGGRWGERYSLSLVSPSVVPNYFPTMRVVEYNVTGLEGKTSVHQVGLPTEVEEGSCRKKNTRGEIEDDERDGTEKKKKKKKKHPKHKKPNYVIPDPPPKTAPPGPAYSPQAFSWLGYTQYFANITTINNDFSENSVADDFDTEKWHNGKHSGKKPKEKSKKHTNNFEFEVEYDTRNDSVFKLKDLSVRSYLDLAGRIGQYKPSKGDLYDQDPSTVLNTSGNDATAESDAANDEDKDLFLCDGTDVSVLKKKKHKKHKHRKAINKVWFTFVNRAYVGSRDDRDLHDEFGQPVE